jgi:hypothetical protein
MFAFKSRTATLAFAAALFFLATLTAPPPAYAAGQLDIPTVHFHTAKVDGIDIFYREAGPAQELDVMAPMIHDLLDHSIGQPG